MFQLSTVYIVWNGSHKVIESVWSTESLARAAIEYHSNRSHLHRSNYLVYAKEINKTNANG